MNNLPLIYLKDASRYYKTGDVHAINEISLSIEKGEFVSIIGTSGSGKSTLLNILGCLDVVTSGEYVLNGTKVGELDNEAISQIRNNEIGFVFQMFHLLKDYTAIENVMLPLLYKGVVKNEAHDIAEAYLEKVNMQNRMHHRPYELSGGQQQRISIARALVNKPSIILADEPTGNLDSTTSIEIMNLITEIRDMGETVIYITHENDLAEWAERTITIIDGKIQEDKLNRKN